MGLMTTTTESPEQANDEATRRLRLVLRANAGFSALSGTAALVAGGPIADFLGLDQTWLVRLVGAGLVLFAVGVLAASAKEPPRLATEALIVSLNDFGWVVGTVVVIALGLLSTGGAVAMGLIGVIVLDFGLAQLHTRRRLLA